MVSNNLSGSSQTIRNTVCVGGSSMSFNSLLAQARFILSGNHTMQTL